MGYVDDLRRRLYSSDAVCSMGFECGGVRVCEDSVLNLWIGDRTVSVDANGDPDAPEGTFYCNELTADDVVAMVVVDQAVALLAEACGLLAEASDLMIDMAADMLRYAGEAEGTRACRAVADIVSRIYPAVEGVGR